MAKKVYLSVESDEIFSYWGTEDNPLLEKSDSDYFSYLKKGEKIISLKREIKTREKKHGEVFESIKKPSYEEAIKWLKRRWKKDLLSDQEKLKKLDVSKFFKSFNVNPVENDSTAKYVIYRASQRGFQKNWRIEVEYLNGKKGVFLASENLKKNCNYTGWGNRRVAYIEYMTLDLPTLLANIELYNMVYDELQKNPEEFDFGWLRHDGSEVYYKLKKDAEWYNDIPIPEFTTRESAREVMGENAIDVEHIGRVRYFLIKEHQLHKPDMFPGDQSKNKSPYYIFDEYYYTFVMNELIGQICEEARLEKRKRNYEAAQASSYARSFMTKQNIPEKVVNSMSNSKFNKWFGFVEFDELTKLSLISQLEKEFKAFQDFLFGPENNNITKDNALRFRRLGNHKASGLYYPTVGCLCVDIRNVSSFIHEYGHLLDYTHGEASSKKDFKGLFKRYEVCLKDSLRKGEVKLKGKYDIDYYLTPTEVFARCFEMFMKRIKKMNNSLLGECVGFAYPEDEMLEEQISDYFTGFFNFSERKE